MEPTCLIGVAWVSHGICTSFPAREELIKHLGVLQQPYLIIEHYILGSGKPDGW